MPAGMLVDNAMGMVAALRPRQDEAALRAAFKAGFAVEARYGWTGLHFMSVSWPEVTLLEKLDGEAQVPLRVYDAVDLDQAAPLFASGPRSTPDGRVTTRAIKIYADGALGSRGAALFEPYADAPTTTGLMKLTPEATAPALAQAMAKGIQVCTHAIGDKANHVMLDLYQQAEATAPAGVDAKAARWRIEHAQNLVAADIPRFKALGVIASMQPSHAIGDLHFAAERLGMERLSEAYDWKSLVDSGAVVVGGTDAPVERGDPLIEFYAAVARKDLKGYSGPGWHPEQAVDRATALKMFTAWPAYARFAEGELGTLEVGKRADLTAFSVDLMTAPEAAIPKGHAVLTIVDGQVAYAAEGEP
jgi:predicted amidohydrolase YtcJ